MFVNDKEDIKNNLIQFENYLNKGKEEERAYCKKLIKNGFCFVVYKVNGETKFSPSRYIGYKDNSISAHKNRNRKDGKITNKEINKILGNKSEDTNLEVEYSNYCDNLEIKQPNKKRSYWNFGDLSQSSNIIPDEEKLQASPTTGLATIETRIGQDEFRKKLIKYWRGCCAVTGINMVDILKSSHIKPWAKSTDKERLDKYNGLLLNPTLDTLFDKGFITFLDNGKIKISKQVSRNNYSILGITENSQLSTVAEEHKKYLKFHCDEIFDK